MPWRMWPSGIAVCKQSIHVARLPCLPGRRARGVAMYVCGLLAPGVGMAWPSRYIEREREREREIDR